MKRFLALAALVALPAITQAQTTSNGSIGVSADISTVLKFGTSSSLAFGAIVPGASASASGYIPLDRNVGVIFTLPDAANTGRLTRSGGTETIQPSYTCGVGSTNAAITTGQSFSSCTPATGTTAVLTLVAPVGNAVTTQYVIFNGSLSTTQTVAVPGTYLGTINITATAN